MNRPNCTNTFELIVKRFKFHFENILSLFLHLYFLESKLISFFFSLPYLFVYYLFGISLCKIIWLICFNFLSIPVLVRRDYMYRGTCLFGGKYERGKIFLLINVLFLCKPEWTMMVLLLRHVLVEYDVVAVSRRSLWPHSNRILSTLYFIITFYKRNMAHKRIVN